MKLIYMISILMVILAVNGCTSTKNNKAVTEVSDQHHSVTLKNPIAVTLYTGKQKPEKPYVVLGHESVSKYNAVGIKRQEANLKDSIRRIAATKGGDAVIDITQDSDTISYTVISYQGTLA